MNYSLPESQIYFDEGQFKDLQESLQKSTHLGVGAHPDDLEVMAHHGIIECLNSETKHFFGVTCTTGSGSHKSGPFADMSDEEFVGQRVSEQMKSAKLGKMAGCLLLGFESAEIKSSLNQKMVDQLSEILEFGQPEIIYTHNPFDKHKTHVGVTLHLVKALQKINFKPKHFFGCEVWRGLDWVEDGQKKILEIKDSELVKSLVGCHHSQLVDKDYGEATIGRMKSNATFFDSSKGDDVKLQLFAIDLLPLLNGLDIQTFTNQYLDGFSRDVRKNLAGLV